MQTPSNPENATFRSAIRSAERRLRTLVTLWNDLPPPRAKHRIKAVADALLRVLRNGNPKPPKK